MSLDMLFFCLNGAISLENAQTSLKFKALLAIIEVFSYCYQQ